MSVDNSEQETYILTAKENLKIGAKLPARLRDMMAIRVRKKKDGSETSELIINNEYENDPDVVQAIEFFEACGRVNTRIGATSAEIKSLYNQSEKITTSHSAIQNEIKEFFVNAAAENCSDMHITVKENIGTVIENRRLCDLYIYKNLSYELGDAICRTIYQTMCNVADKSFMPKKQQDGRVPNTFLPDSLVGVRIATTPTDNGYKMVARLLYKIDPASLTLKKLGYEDFQIAALMEIEAKNAGAVFISGPTGSGKSSTLMVMISALISKLNGKVHVITIEDPPEYEIYGMREVDHPIFDRNGLVVAVEKRKIRSAATQIPITNYKTDQERATKFNDGIRAAMRLDPDIIMIGEIRDSTSAEAALRASMTGHKVYTTIHANNASTIFSRLFDIGIRKEIACDANVITGLLAQLLVRKLCPHCCIPLVGNEDLLDQELLQRLSNLFQLLDSNLANIKLKNSAGCNKCFAGIASRTVIAEIIVCDEHFMELALMEKRSEQKRYWMNELKGVDMMMHAIIKLKRGICDPGDIEDQVGLIKLAKETDIAHFKSLIHQEDATAREVDLNVVPAS